jgi:glycosyltransferase involved in cell wall biosynthesis
MCFWLVEELVRRGHEVTLVAAGKNRTRANFIQTYARPPTEQLGTSIPEIVHAGVANRLLSGREFDIVHDHSFAGPLLSRARQCPTVITAHGPVDGVLGDYYREMCTAASLVAISSAQRRKRPSLPWVATIHNAIPTDDYPFNETKENFALWLGRMSPEKGAHVAIDAARRAGWPLKLAGKCNELAERRYFELEVRPRLGSDIEWLGEADTECKKDLLARAACLLFPIQWPEPFGIVMVEAMACGTPVVALNEGSVPEILVDGVTGYVCNHSSELPEALDKSQKISADACRRHASTSFEATTMASRYEAVYSALIAGQAPTPNGTVRVQAHRRDPDDVIVERLSTI